MDRYIKNLKYTALLSFLLATAFGCSNDDDVQSVEEQQPQYTAGTADFSNFVALGNSLTAGFTDGDLFQAGQQNSLPNILASQFVEVGGGEFTHPLMGDNIGGLVLGGTSLQETRLYFNGSGPERLQATS